MQLKDAQEARERAEEKAAKYQVIQGSVGLLIAWSEDCLRLSALQVNNHGYANTWTLTRRFLTLSLRSH